jgi:hypothetical protein
MALKGVRKLYFAFPCGEFGVIIVGFGEQWGGRCYGRANGIGGWADFWEVFRG